MDSTITLGDITISRIVEQENGFFPVREFFPSLTAEVLDENRSWLQPFFVDEQDRIRLCIQSYVVRTPTRTILIDTCVGNHKPRPNRAFWDRMTSDRYARGLAAIGLTPGDIDVVMCTHLHVDHVGWNTTLVDGRWVPTFPRAKYIFSKKELEFWTGRHAAKPETCPWIGDSVLPIVDDNKATLVDSDHVLDDRVTLVPTPGHTIDHYSVLVGRPGHDALVTGDMIHSPLQAKYPEIGMFSDFSSTMAGETRRRIFECYCDTATLFCTAHFPSPSVGRMGRSGDGFRFIPVD